MPVLIQWKWQENTKTYLVIFHFLDDFSAPNLRMTKVSLSKVKGGFEHEPFKPTSLMTWAPSHPELALISEVLSYANIINGLGYDEKMEIRDFLEGSAYLLARKKDKKPVAFLSFTTIELLEASQFRQLIGTTKEGVYQCFALTPEYIEYLKKALKIVQTPDHIKEKLQIERIITVVRITSSD